MIKRPILPLMLLTLASIFLFFLLNLLFGSVHIPLRSVWNILWGNTDESVIWQNIIWKSRVPQALTALVAGAGLSVSGLQMQTVFRNPLAGPSVLGISSGASLGVACVSPETRAKLPNPQMTYARISSSTLKYFNTPMTALAT